MKKSKYLYALALLFLALTGVMSSCYKDKGNYTYSNVDSVAITGIADSYQIGKGATTKISPVLTMESQTAFNDTAFTYEWVYYDKVNISGNRKLLYAGKNLDTILPLAIGNYDFYYTIKQKTTGITWQKKFTLEITGAFKKAGWFVLNDISGQSRVDYYEDNSAAWNTFPVRYRNITGLINDVNTGEPLQLTGNPKSLTAFANRDIINTTSTYYLYVNTENATTKINITDGFISNKIKYLFSNETAFGTPASVEYVEPASLGSPAAYAYKAGDIYCYYYAIANYGTPLNRLAGGSRFAVSPYFAAPSNSPLHALWYDTENKRFVRTQYTSATASLITSSISGLDLSNVGKDLVWMGYSRLSNGQVIAILKDSNNHYYLARIGFATSTTPVITALSIIDITDKLTGIAQADKFTIDQQFGYLFYTSGSKLYQYDMDNQVVKMARDYGSRKISMLKVNKLTYLTAIGTTAFTVYFSRLEAPAYSIIVGSYDPASPDNSGTIDFLKAPALMGSLTTYFDSFTGLGKVVDVKYSEL